MEKAVILLVDDEEDIRRLSILQIKRNLRDQQFEFFEAGNGEEALALLRQGLKPSLIILDYAMPRVNGIELLRRIANDHDDLCAVPRIMISGYLPEDIKSEVQRLECVFFEKSMDVKSFYQQICRHIASRLGFAQEMSGRK